MSRFRIAHILGLLPSVALFACIYEDSSARSVLPPNSDSGVDVSASFDASGSAGLSGSGGSKEDVGAGGFGGLADARRDVSAEANTDEAGDAPLLDATNAESDAPSDEASAPETGGAGGGSGIYGNPGVGGHSSGICDSLLVESPNPSAPYPPTFVPPSDASDRFDTYQSAFLTHYGVSSSDYSILPFPITWVPDISTSLSVTNPILLSDQAPLPHDSLIAVSRDFLAKWETFFGAAGLSLSVTGLSGGCSSLCRIDFGQDYCGLQVRSNAEYSAQISVLAHADGAQLKLIHLWDRLVPMIPVLVRPTWTLDQVRDSLVGKTFQQECGDGTHEYVISDQARFSFGPLLTLFLEADNLSNALVYRTTYELTLSPDPAQQQVSWILYVDCFDGTIRKQQPAFSC